MISLIRVRAVSSGYGCIDILQAGIHKAWGLEDTKRWDLKLQQLWLLVTVKMMLKCLKWLELPMMENADDKAKLWRLL